MKKKLKNKVQNRKNERRNIKNKERELRRKKQFQHNQEKKSVKKLWSIPQPEECTFDERGYKKLFHYTTGEKLHSILKYGIILGGVCVINNKGFNTPCLTTENEFHNPSLIPIEQLETIRDGYYRLTIECPTDADKLINYGWFDKTYCKNNIRRLNEKHPECGNVDKQYLYLGHIKTSMIKEIKVWNSKTNYWDRPRKKEIIDLCKEYENLPFLYKHVYKPYYPRILGFELNDYTGKVSQYHAENDCKDILRDLYVLSDYLCDIFQRSNIKKRYVKQIEQYHSNINNHFREDNHSDVIYEVVETYNKFVSKSDKINLNEFVNCLNKTGVEFLNWLKNEKKEVELKLVA